MNRRHRTANATNTPLPEAATAADQEELQAEFEFDLLDTPGEVEDSVVDNAPVRRHQHDRWTIEGFGLAAVQSYWRIPELKIGFDLGLQPWSFMTTKTWAVSHAHLDHIAALPVYVARRRLMRMEPPRIFLPRENVADVELLLDAMNRLDRGRLPCELIGCKPGDEFDLSREEVLTTFATFHTVPSLGYIVWDRRRKLKPEYHGLANDQIRDLRLSGTEVTQEVRIPLVAYLGDSNPRAFDHCPELFQAKILLTEITFFAPNHRRDKIHKFGHIHLDDIIERADLFQNELIVAGHFSTRYHESQIRRMVDKRLPTSLRDRLMLWF